MGIFDRKSIEIQWNSMEFNGIRRKAGLFMAFTSFRTALIDSGMNCACRISSA